MYLVMHRGRNGAHKYFFETRREALEAKEALEEKHKGIVVKIFEININEEIED